MQPYTCWWCDDSFTTDERHDEHVREYHPTIECNWCKEDGFLDHEEFAEHVREGHPDVLPECLVE